VLTVARRAGAFERGITDYNRFIELGIVSADIENQMGLLRLEQPDRDLDAAEVHFKKAATENQVSIYQANHALCQFLKKQYADTIGTSLLAGFGDPDGNFPQRYVGMVAVALARTLGTKDMELPPQTLKHLLDGTAASPEGGWVACSDTAVEQARVMIEKQISQSP
jgi:hypothetical protein